MHLKCRLQNVDHFVSASMCYFAFDVNKCFNNRIDQIPAEFRGDCITSNLVSDGLEKLQLRDTLSCCEYGASVQEW